jgi:uncharacterized HAD superfamily protein
VCVDIDGVLADATHRQYLLDYHDWDSFFMAVGEDGLLEPQAAMLRLVGADHVIALVTSRPQWIADRTTNWLMRHDIRWDVLIMRSNGDYRQAPAVKASAVEQLRDAGFDPVLAFDDDVRNVAAYDRSGVPCVYIHSGYHPVD